MYIFTTSNKQKTLGSSRSEVSLMTIILHPENSHVPNVFGRTFHCLISKLENDFESMFCAENSALCILDFGLPLDRSQVWNWTIFSLLPSASPTTVPWEVFMTHPTRCNFSASFKVYLRKNTPCTFPNTSNFNRSMRKSLWQRLH